MSIGLASSPLGSTVSSNLTGPDLSDVLLYLNLDERSSTRRSSASLNIVFCSQSFYIGFLSKYSKLQMSFCYIKRLSPSPFEDYSGQ